MAGLSLIWLISDGALTGKGGDMYRKIIKEEYFTFLLDQKTITQSLGQSQNCTQQVQNVETTSIQR